MAEYGKGRAQGYSDFLKNGNSSEEETDITQLSDADKKKLAIKRRLAKMKKSKG